MQLYNLKRKESIQIINWSYPVTEKGFDNDPVRCPDCRRARKQQNNRR
jgi:hypothetical protein